MSGRFPYHIARPLIGALLLSVLAIACVWPDARPTPPHDAAIASAHPLATRAGMEILEAGGNAFDAAVAVSAVLAVVEPQSSGLGGGGFWLLHRARDGFETVIDGREMAPGAAHRDMYLDSGGEVVPRLSVDGALAAGIPGEPAALAHIAEHYGRLPLAQSLAPAIRLARGGFSADEQYRKYAQFRLAALQNDPAAAAVFLDNDDVPEPGRQIVQADLADTLQALAQRGHAGFYGGEVAERLVEGVRAAGGIWTLDDLTQYHVIERTPLRGRYRGLTITSVPPPSSGGIALIEMLNMLAGFDLAHMTPAERMHTAIEAMRRAYRDRAEFLGDSDFVAVPVERLTGRVHADRIAASIHPQRATPSSQLPGYALPEGGSDTTHLSVLDAEGNRVAATLSINYPFGAAVMPAGTGVLLNNEMDDFSVSPGVPNLYGLVGAAANAIEPGKRPLSSMSPTFVENARGVGILGTPGGSRIITMLLLGVLDIADGGLPESWVSLPRYHHQYLPDEVRFEPGTLSEEVQETLRMNGYTLRESESTWGNMQAIWHDRVSGKVHAASDPRGGGAAVASRIRRVAR